MLHLSSQTDQRTYGDIHSIKEGEIAAEASPIIKEKTASLLAATDDDDSDPFANSNIEEDDDDFQDAVILIPAQIPPVPSSSLPLMHERFISVKS